MCIRDSFTADTPLTTTGLLDAVVYGDAAGAAGLLPLLLTGETAVDEDGRDAADRHSIQRCPNGAGGQRRTDAFRPNDPTPGAPSHCTADDPPMVLETTPSGGAAHVAVDSTLAVVFSEPMTADAGWLRLVCADVERALTITMDGATTYTVSYTHLDVYKRQALDGLALVFYNGYANTVYYAIDLDGQRTNAAGYWVAGNVALSPDLVFANGGLQNGPDAVALYAGEAAHFTADTPLTLSLIHI